MNSREENFELDRNNKKIEPKNWSMKRENLQIYLISLIYIIISYLKIYMMNFKFILFFFFNNIWNFKFFLKYKNFICFNCFMKLNFIFQNFRI
jgi:hypothetical protein